MPDKKVVHVTTVDWSIRYLLWNQLKTIQNAGYEVAVVTTPTPFAEVIQAEGMLFYGISFPRQISPVADLIALRQMWNLFKQIKPTIVHTHNPKTGLLGQIAAYLAGVPIVINTVHGFYFTNDSPYVHRQFYMYMEKIAGKFSTHILSQNKEDINLAIQSKICPAAKISYLGNGINLTRFNPDLYSPSMRHTLRQSLNIKPDNIVVGAIGRLVEEKGYNELIQAAAQITKKYPQTVFVVIGPVDEAKKDVFRPEVAAQYGLKLGENILFLGMRQDIPELLSIMDIFAFPSYREGFPRALMEAAAMGLACIATDIRGCREVIMPQQTGLLIPPRSVTTLVDALQTFIESPSLRHNLGAQARSYALQHFDEQQVFQKVLTCYKSCLERL